VSILVSLVTFHTFVISDNRLPAPKKKLIEIDHGAQFFILKKKALSKKSNVAIPLDSR
jgi:hypothetical protein